VGSMLRLVLAGLLLLLAIAPAAEAASTTQILRDCADDGVLQGHYTPAELRKARNNIPTDTDQYTDCRDVLARAAANAAAGNGNASGSGGGGGGFGGGTGGGGSTPQGPLTPSTPEDQNTLNQALRDGGKGVDVGGSSVVPGAVGFNADAARNTLPTTLIVLLALLGAATLAMFLPSVRRASAGPLTRLRHVVGRG
jgi:hypothetical protein